MQRRFPIGAELQGDGSTHFRVWAPASQRASIEFFARDGTTERAVGLAAEAGGYFSGAVRDVAAGARYKIQLDAGSFPDPASRFQPEGPHGPSQVVDSTYPWSDRAWHGRPASELVIYEMHLGTFTPEGTWRSAMVHLPELARLGITMIEVMPIADFPGKFGWGYDGVNLFAPCRLYGTPSDARAFIDRAHELGVMVILDVVYNHLGPDGNYLLPFSRDYISARYKNEWGDALNFDGDNSRPVREFFLTNACYWIDEFHFDGLRLDATQQIYDASETHLLAELSAAVRKIARGREIFIVGENESQHARLARSRDAGGYGLDALWNDDFHHAAKVAATGRAEAYYSGYRGRPQEFVSAVKRGFLYQGQWYRWQAQRRGRPALDLGLRQFVHFLQNHDQIANSIRGLRLHQTTSPGNYRALTALLLLSPQIPMLFQGQEFSASAPFLFFADHHPELAKRVSSGRRQFLQQFPTIAAADCREVHLEPSDPETFRRCKLDHGERARNSAVYRLHEHLLQLRREDPTLANPASVDGAVLAESAFVLRFFSAHGDDRILVVNLGCDVRVEPAPEPLLAPLEGKGWGVRWSSESPIYEGGGTPPLETKSNWLIPGHAAILMGSDENAELPDAKLREKN